MLPRKITSCLGKRFTEHCGVCPSDVLTGTCEPVNCGLRIRVSEPATLLVPPVLLKSKTIRRGGFSTSDVVSPALIRVRKLKPTVRSSSSMAMPPPNFTEIMFSNLRSGAKDFPKPKDVTISYGTAGFRLEASLLPSTAFCGGVLAALRALQLAQVTGVMVTASHNPVADNGLKLADPGGGMLPISWEGYANRLAEATDAEALCQVVEEVMQAECIHRGPEKEGKVLVAMDTRPSGPPLSKAVQLGIVCVPGVTAVDLGVLTTPQLHWMVRSTNRGLPAQESDYYNALTSGYQKLINLNPKPHASLEGGKEAGGVLVDGANGVGAKKLGDLAPGWAQLGLHVEVRNDGRGGGELNHLVGADFVQKERQPPQGFGKEEEVGRRCVSVDGDCDRAVYFYHQTAPTPSFHVLDGDKIAALAATLIGDQLRELGDSRQAEGGPAEVEGFGVVAVGVVQTAYANGSSTEYITQKLKLPVVRTPTGVKHLHHEALKFDVGIYFESNGHGTVLFGERFLHWLNQAQLAEGCRGRAAQRLVALSEAVNQAVGDAISLILLVEAALLYRGWSVQQWDALYHDLPTRQLKVKVGDRTRMKTADAETRVVEPVGLQAAIDGEVAKIRCGRAFVRPSGTEDVVRVYAEAETQEEADELAQKVAAHVRTRSDRHLASVGGVGRVSVQKGLERK